MYRRDSPAAGSKRRSPHLVAITTSSRRPTSARPRICSAGSRSAAGGTPGRSKVGDARVSHPVTYARRADAARVLVELERQAQSGGPLVGSAGRKMPLRDYALQWLDQHPSLRPRTVEVYRSLLNRHVLPTLGDVRLSRLDTATVREWRALLAKRGTSKTMVAKSYRLLRAILNTAVVEDELIVANPCKIKGAGEERADERPALTIPQLFDLVEMVPER